MAKVAIGTRVHCNKCDEGFELDVEMKRGDFCGSKAARLEQFCKCPHCGRSDSHWVYANDIAPTFAGGFDARKRALRKWLRDN